MSEAGWLRYVVSVGALTLPILAWNVVCTRYLPAPLASFEFNRDIPPLMRYCENCSSGYWNTSSRGIPNALTI